MSAPTTYGEEDRTASSGSSETQTLPHRRIQPTDGNCSRTNQKTAVFLTQ